MLPATPPCAEAFVPGRKLLSQMHEVPEKMWVLLQASTSWAPAPGQPLPTVHHTLIPPLLSVRTSRHLMCLLSSCYMRPLNDV